MGRLIPRGAGVGDRASILVIEDDVALRDMVKMALEDENYEVQVAGNGREGLECLARQKPDLILLDLRMPVMSGWEFAREMQARNGHPAPVLVMSAAKDAEREAAQIGAVGCLAKPFTLDGLARAVHKHLAGPVRSS